MKVLAGLLSVVLIGALLAVIAQHVRYLRARRDVVMDRQPLFHASSVFHVATVVALGPEQELLRAVRGLVDASEKSGARVIYAGKVAVNAMASSQLPRHEWDAFVLAQYPSREAHEAAAGNPELQKARSGCAGRCMPSA